MAAASKNTYITLAGCYSHFNTKNVVAKKCNVLATFETRLKQSQLKRSLLLVC